MLNIPFFSGAPASDREVGRMDFMDIRPRQQGCSWMYFLGYFEAMAEEVQRLRKSDLRKLDTSP